MPQPLTHLNQFRIVFLQGKFCNGCEKVHGPHSMAFHSVLLPHGQVGLAVRIVKAIGSRIFPPGFRLCVKIVGLLPPFLDEKLREFQVRGVIGDPVQLEQSQFNLFVPGVAPLLALSWAEDFPDVIYHPAHDLQQLVFPRRLVIRHSSFNKVPCAIQFMVVPEVGPAALKTCDGVI